MVEEIVEAANASRLTSRKFWALNTAILVTFVAMWRILEQLGDLVKAEKIGESVFENLYGLSLTTGALFLAFMIGLYFGINLAQHIKLAQIGSGK